MIDFDCEVWAVFYPTAMHLYPWRYRSGNTSLLYKSAYARTHEWLRLGIIYILLILDLMDAKVVKKKGKHTYIQTLI